MMVYTGASYVHPLRLSSPPPPPPPPSSPPPRPPRRVGEARARSTLAAIGYILNEA